jgi:uncharacterized protein YbjT (DUF2867 family)
MNITVVGATGGTGNELVRQLIAKGHTVTAFVRKPQKLGDLAENITVVQGDARNYEALIRAITGSDAVMSALGPRTLKKDDVQSVFFTNVVQAMNQIGVSRFICLSAWGAGDSGNKTPMAMKLLQKTVLKNMFADKNKGESVIITSPLHYTLVRPGQLQNGLPKGNVKASVDGHGLSKQIARADVAAFMIDQLNDLTWDRQAPIIGY